MMSNAVDCERACPVARAADGVEPSAPHNTMVH